MASFLACILEVDSFIINLVIMARLCIIIIELCWKVPWDSDWFLLRQQLYAVWLYLYRIHFKEHSDDLLKASILEIQNSFHGSNTICHRQIVLLPWKELERWIIVVLSCHWDLFHLIVVSRYGSWFGSIE